MRRPARYRGYFSGISSQEAVPTAAHILLRTSAFTSQLPSIYENHPDFDLNLIYLDLYAQLQSKEESLDVFPLLQHSPSGSIVECLPEFLLTFQAKLILGWRHPFICSSGTSPVPIIKPTSSVPIDAWFHLRKFPTRVSSFFFLDVRDNTSTIPSSVFAGGLSYDLYVVVNQRDRDSCELFIRDALGWVRFRENTIEPAANYSAEGVILVGYVEDLSRVEMFRAPTADQVPVKRLHTDQFVLKYNVLNSRTMSLDGSEHRFDSREALRRFVEESNSRARRREVRYETDLGEPPRRFLPEFSKTVTLYEYFGTGTLSNYGRFIDGFLGVKPVELQFRFFAVQALSVTASFHPADSADSLFRFARRLLDVIKLQATATLRLFETASAFPNEIEEFDTLVKVQKFVGHPILVCHDHQVPTIGRRPSIGNDVAAANTITVTLIRGRTELKESTRVVAVRQGMRGVDLIEAVRDWFSSADKLGIFVLQPGGLGLTQMDQGLPVDTLRKNGALRAQPIWTFSCPLVVLDSVRPLRPSGRVYLMPLDSGILDLCTEMPTSFAARVERFLGHQIREVGVMEKNGPKTKGRFSFFASEALDVYVYVILAYDRPGASGKFAC
jgi:hypothetical protein